MLEKEIEKHLTNATKTQHGVAYKFVSPGHSGVPDRLVILPGGKIGFAELKQQGKTPTPLQRTQMKMLQDLGCVVEVIDTTQKADLFIKKIMGCGTDEH